MQISIEAGHFYLYQSEAKEKTRALSEEQLLGIHIAVEVAQGLGMLPQFILFVDDYHGKPDQEIDQPLKNHPQVSAVMAYFNELGIEPHLVSELELTSTAIYLYSQLVKKGAVRAGTTQLLTEQGAVSLLTKDKQPTCSLIDAAFYLRKIGSDQNHPTITVLPHDYHSQQAEVQLILGAYGLVNPPITVMYHNAIGEVVQVEEWSQLKEQPIYENK